MIETTLSLIRRPWVNEVAMSTCADRCRKSYTGKVLTCYEIHVYTVYNAIYGDHDYDKCSGAANFDLHVSGADPEGGEGDVHPL